MGAKKFESLIKKQRQYCADFFKIEEEPTAKETIEAPSVEKPLEINKDEPVSDSISNDEKNDSKEADEIKKEEK